MTASSTKSAESPLKSSTVPDKKQLLRKKFQQFINHRQLKNTKSRQIVLDYFLTLKSGHHESAENVYKSLSKQGYKIGLATIYRAINLMTEAKVLEHHTFRQSSSVYEVNYMHHDHLVCLDCGLIKEFEDSAIEARQLAISKTLGFQLEFHKLELFGKCLTPNCSQLPNGTQFDKG